MQYNQPPQYVTHRAQQQLIKEFSQPSSGNHITSNREDSIPSQRDSDTRQSVHYFQSQRVFSNDPHYSQMRASQQLMEPQSAKIPMGSTIMENSNYVLSARAQLPQKSRRSNDKSSSELGSFAQALGYMQNMGSKSSAMECMSARQQQYASEAATIKRAIPQNIQQAQPCSNQYESHSSRNHGQLGSNSNNVNGENSYMGENSFQTGKDFADMVSIETANCRKQNHHSQVSHQGQQNYKTGYEIQSSTQVNSQKSPQNKLEIQTAIKDSKNLSSNSNDQQKSDNCETINFSGQTEQNMVSKSLNFSRATIQNSNVRENQVIDSSRVVPQMYMKQMCSGLNTSAISLQNNTIASGRKNIQISTRDKNQYLNHSALNGQKFHKQHSAEMNGPSNKAQIQKQCKSSDRMPKGSKPQAASYSPFQSRLYHQYQTAVPANQTFQSNGMIQSESSNNPKDLSNYNYLKKESSPDANLSMRQPSTKPQRPKFSRNDSNELKAQQNQAQVCSATSLRHPKVMEQQRKDQNQHVQYAQTQMSSTGVLTKSPGDRANTQTVIRQDSSRPSSNSNSNSQQRHSSAAYKRTDDAYANLARNQFRSEGVYHQRQKNSPDGIPDEAAANTFFQKYKENQLQKAPQKHIRQVPVQSPIEQAGGHSNKKNNQNYRVYQTQTNKSACTTARGPGPIIGSGPLNPPGQKSAAVNCYHNDGTQRNTNSYLRVSQMRQNASGLAQKVARTSSRKSLGFQSNLTSVANSKKQIETAKLSNMRGTFSGTIDEKNNNSYSKNQQRHGKTGTIVRNTNTSYKSPLVHSHANATVLGTQRGKQATYSAHQHPNDLQHPRVSPKSASSVNKSLIKTSQKPGSGQIQLSSQQTTASNARARHTPTKVDQNRKSKVSPFKATPNQSNIYKNTDGNCQYVEGESSCKQTSPDQSSIITADLKYLYERQKKMVAQLSQNKLGTANQPQGPAYKHVPGLTLETINEKIPGTLVHWSQTPKQYQNVFTPSSSSLGPNGHVQISKTVRGNPPPSYQAFVEQQQVAQGHKDFYQQNPLNTTQSSNHHQQQYQNQSGSSSQLNYTTLMAGKLLALGESRQPYSNTVVRKSSGVSATTTHRDFVQENKRVYAQPNTEKLQTIQVQQRGAHSQGKAQAVVKPSSKEKMRGELRASNLMMTNERVTPKKMMDKKDLNVQKQKTRNDMNKTQYLSKKSALATQQRTKHSQQYQHNQTAQMVKSPSYKGFMATQTTDMLNRSNLLTDHYNKCINKQRTSEQAHKPAQLVVKNKSKTQGLNMTINIQSSLPRHEMNSNVNTYRGVTCKSQTKYLHTLHEEQSNVSGSKMSHKDKSRTMKAEDIAEYLRTVQSSQAQQDNSEIFTFAQHQGTLDTRNPTFQQQITGGKHKNSNRSSEKVHCQIQISECSREALLLQKQTKVLQFSESAFKPTAQNSHASQRETVLAINQQNCRREDIHNILINSHQSKNFQVSQSSKGIYNNSKLGCKNSNSSPTKKNDPVACQDVNKNIVSFQQIQEKSVRSQEQKSPTKKMTYKEDKENIHKRVKAIEINKIDYTNPAQVFFSEIAEKHKVKQLTPKHIEMKPIETQYEDTENKPTDCKVPNKTNIQQNIQQYLQAQQQERQALAPKVQNVIEQPPQPKVEVATVQTTIQQAPAPPVTAMSNHQNNINDTMCFSQKQSLDDYVIGKNIGQGAYAAVRIGLHKPTNKKVAMKIYKKYKLEEPNRRKSVKREIKLMEKMKHDSIVQLFEIIDTQKYVILIMEYVGGGSLHGYLKSKPKRRLEEWDAKRIFKQIIEGLRYCHSRCITHRDIKLENLLLDDKKKIKIIDFGFSTCIPNDKRIKIFCGTPSYMAPEIVLKTEYCGPPADIWAMGVLLFTILSGQFPYRGATDEELYDKICRADYHLPKDVKEQLSPAAKDLLSKLFSINADNRPTAKQILEHQWLYNIDTKDLNVPPHNDSITQIQSSDCLQLQKRAKSQRLDCIGAPKNKTGDAGNQQVERRVAVNPFNITTQNAQPEHQQPHQHPETKRSLSKIGSHAARSSSHAAGKSSLHINNKVIDLISAKLGYDPQDVEYQVRQDLLLSENKDQSSQMKNQTSFVGNLYFRLLDEEDNDSRQPKALDTRAKSDISGSEQQNLFMGSDVKSQQKSDNGVGYHSNNVFNQTQQLLMKSAISQTSLGMSGGNMTSQGFGQGNGTQNLAIQPSFVPSIKSLNSGGQMGTTSLSQLNFNNTMTSSANFNSQLHQNHNLNFNNTQPLKGILQNLNDAQNFASTPDNKRDNQGLPLNFTQTNIFVTNNNQVFGQHQESNGNNLQIEEPDQLFNMLPTRLQQNQKRLMNTQQSKAANGLLVNNFFSERVNGERDNADVQEQESPNFRKGSEPMGYTTQA